MKRMALNLDIEEDYNPYTIYEIMIETNRPNRTVKYICNGRFEGYPFWNLEYSKKHLNIHIKDKHIGIINSSKLYQMEDEQGVFYKTLIELYNNLGLSEHIVVNCMISDEKNVN